MMDKTPGEGQEDEDFCLGDGSWEALIQAAHDVEEMLRDDLELARSGVSITEANLAQLMPRRFIPRYDLIFMERLAQTSADLTERLERAQKHRLVPYASFLNSVAEEMLMSQVIQLAMDGANSEEQVDDLEALQDLSFEDRDFEWLYDFSHDGVVDDPEVSRFAGFANLKFDDWFKPFRSSSRKPSRALR